MRLVELFDGELAADLPHPRTQGGVDKQNFDRVGQRSRILGTNQRPVAARFHHHPAAFDVGGVDDLHVTLFDGVYRPVKGQEGAETAVEIINPKSIRIYNKRNGVLNQVVINTLSDDNNTINNEYIRMDKDGKITGVTHVTYIRRKK